MRSVEKCSSRADQLISVSRERILARSVFQPFISSLIQVLSTWLEENKTTVIWSTPVSFPRLAPVALNTIIRLFACVFYWCYSTFAPFLLHIRSAHLGIFGFLKEFAPWYNNILARFMTMWKKQILARANRNQKKIWGNHAFFRDNWLELKFGKKLPYILCILTLF